MDTVPPRLLLFPDGELRYSLVCGHDLAANFRGYNFCAA